MTEPVAETSPVADSGVRSFWRGFVAPALLVPLMWALLVGLTLPDYVVPFYVIVILAVPLSLSLVLVPGWRLAIGPGNVAVRILTLFLMLPAIGVFLWGIYCAWVLAYLILTGQF